ncbi:hypothetical protein [Pseudomonas lini]
METSSIENAINRWKWLDKVLALELPPTKDMLINLKDMKCFCAFSVNGYFIPIAYNTLKSAMHNSKLREITSDSNGNKWTHLLKKRKQAYSLVLSTLNKQKKPTKTKREYESEIKECLWHSHLCSLAYLELYRSITNYAKEQTALPEAARYQLERMIDESGAKFSELVSPQSPIRNLGDLSLVVGGKSEY